ncbi:class I SAM-dependent methyltransferase [Mesosutterella sp. OilRF-GAM-744-9]|uniref:Class I SAM-dependent methyltransferase n=1 Tax=Mesosutterella porci TaxID=2915351 RepID=A0ABS9MNB0_9BURK|nr:class I SAM-dependent methyltransferase [Mesosutterella sp. oilRF-744-WT-GAM-9]MCG5030106.1 class I SAM-dependent methyltransferase [Mesosutterella sp. oilRF-744-WT-GAM-9]
MKPDYKNWIPRRLLYATGFATAVSLFGVATALASLAPGALRTFSLFFFGIALVILAGACAVMLRLTRAFDLNDSGSYARRIIDDIAARAKLAEGGKGLDLGTGTGALAIEVARRHPRSSMVGIDTWPRVFSGGSGSLALCESNARAENVPNVTFEKADASKLPYPDESFDLVVSNYLYSSSSILNKGKMIDEAMRVLKKGGHFVLHDYFGRKEKFGDMSAYVEKLKKAGFEKVELLDTTDGLFITKKESWKLNLSGSELLIGRK